MTPDEFRDRPKSEQARMVATKRGQNIIDYLVGKEQEREMNRKRHGA